MRLLSLTFTNPERRLLISVLSVAPCGPRLVARTETPTLGTSMGSRGLFHIRQCSFGTNLAPLLRMVSIHKSQSLPASRTAKSKLCTWARAGQCCLMGVLTRNAIRTFTVGFFVRTRFPHSVLFDSTLQRPRLFLTFQVLSVLGVLPFTFLGILAPQTSGF